MTLNYQQLYDELFDHARKRQKINTHCYQLPSREYQGFDLDTLLRNSYINWVGIPWDSSILEGGALKLIIL